MRQSILKDMFKGVAYSHAGQYIIHQDIKRLVF